jgi:endonuclease YncB( thermonuclease family)
MKSSKNHVALAYDGDTFTIRVNGKLVSAYRKPDLTRQYLEPVFADLMRLIESSEEPDRELYRLRLECADPPSVGACTLCGRKTNLLGGLCYACAN